MQKSLEELGLHCEDFHVLGVFEADPVRENLIFSCRIENITAIILMEARGGYCEPDQILTEAVVETVFRVLVSFI